MERKDVLKVLNEIFIEILDDEDIVIVESNNASNVDGWDSLTHIMLVVAVEKHFNVKFTSQETISWNNVGEIIDSIKERM